MQVQPTHLVLPRHGFDAADLAALRILAPGGTHVDLSVVFELLWKEGKLEVLLHY